jgi:hypothetical protein
MSKERILDIDKSRFLLVYLGAYQVEVINADLETGSVLFDREHWEDSEGKAFLFPVPGRYTLEEACWELIEHNLKGTAGLNESSGSM